MDELAENLVFKTLIDIEFYNFDYDQYTPIIWRKSPTRPEGVCGGSSLPREQSGVCIKAFNFGVALLIYKFGFRQGGPFYFALLGNEVPICSEELPMLCFVKFVTNIFVGVVINFFLNSVYYKKHLFPLAKTVCLWN